MAVTVGDSELDVAEAAAVLLGPLLAGPPPDCPLLRGESLVSSHMATPAAATTTTAAVMNHRTERDRRGLAGPGASAAGHPADAGSWSTVAPQAAQKRV